MKRIFVAVDISRAAREKAARYIENLKKDFPNLRVGWEKAEKLHLTMKFLGDVDENQLLDLFSACDKITLEISKLQFQASDVRCQILGTGVFPNVKRPRILWLGLRDENGILTRINDHLEAECEKYGFEKENRKFKPHLTIGRLREPQISQKLAETHLQNEFEPVEFEVSEIVIYESKLQPTGSIYSKVKTFKLLV